jgi:hypothetical protein
MECAGAHLLRGACIGPAVIRCGSCGALYYCSQKHQVQKNPQFLRKPDFLFMRKGFWKTKQAKLSEAKQASNFDLKSSDLSFVECICSNLWFFSQDYTEGFTSLRLSLL